MDTKECVDLIRQMVSIPSESQNEKEFAEFLEVYLREELGMETELQHIEGNSFNVIGRWRHPSAERLLLLGGHIDTVAPAAGWDTDPYTLVQRGDMLHGLGAADMKGGLAAQLSVLKRIKTEKRLLNAEIHFLGLADEERHSIGAHAYVKTAKKQDFWNRRCFFLMGEPHYDNIVIGAAGKILLSICVQGKKGHASTPESGINAIECMARFLASLQEKYLPLYSSGKCGSLCCLQIESDYAGYSLTIPSECRCLLNKQLLPSESAEDFIEEIRRLYAETVGEGTLNVIRENPFYPSYCLSPYPQELQDLTELLQHRFSHEPEMRINQSVSDGNILFNALKIPTVLFGPHGVAFHTEKEYVSLSSIRQYMDELYAFILAEYAV